MQCADKKTGIDTPRTVLQQLDASYEVQEFELKPGDLAFYKMGRYNRHVAIYLVKTTLFTLALAAAKCVCSVLIIRIGEADRSIGSNPAGCRRESVSSSCGQYLLI